MSISLSWNNGEKQIQVECGGNYKTDTCKDIATICATWNIIPYEFLTELVPFNVCVWPGGKYKIDQREQENYSGESLWLCELLLDIVVLPDIMAWFTIYNRAWGIQIQTFLLKISGADGEKKYRLALVQMLRVLHIFRLLHEGINNTNSLSSTEIQEILTKVTRTVDTYEIISVCQIILEYMYDSL